MQPTRNPVDGQVRSYAIPTNDETLAMELNATNFTCGDPLPRDEDLAKVEVGIQAAIFSAAVVSNLAVLIVLWRRKKKLTRMHVFVAHLSLTDLFVAFFNILPQMAWDVTYRFKGPDFLCRTVKFTQVCAMFASSYVIVATAMDRYFSIVHPLTSHTWSKKRTTIMIGTAWALSSLFALPNLYLFGSVDLDGCGLTDCFMDEHDPVFMTAYMSVALFLLYFLPLLLLIFAYGRICCIVWSSMGVRARERTPSLTRSDNLLRRNGEGERRKMSSAKMKTLKLTLAVILAYQICWSPFFISQVYYLCVSTEEANSTVSLTIMLLLPSLNSLSNPIIFAVFNGNLGTSIKRRWNASKFTSSSRNRTTMTRLGGTTSNTDDTTSNGTETVGLQQKTISVQLQKAGYDATSC